MPFKSKSQWRKFGMLVKQGKIPKKTFDEFARSSNYSSLPNHEVKKKNKYSAALSGK